MSPNDADGMANSVDPDQTAPLGAVWSGSTLFAQAYLSENLGSLRYYAVFLLLLCFFSNLMRIIFKEGTHKLNQRTTGPVSLTWVLRIC